MARVTIEDCVEHINNRFLLVQAAVKRTRQLMEGSRPLVQSKNRQTVVALREIATELVKIRERASKLDIPEPPPLAQEEEEAIADAAIQEINLDDLAATEGKKEGQQGSKQADDPEEEQAVKKGGKKA